MGGIGVMGPSSPASAGASISFFLPKRPFFSGFVGSVSAPGGGASAETAGSGTGGSSFASAFFFEKRPFLSLPFLPAFGASGAGGSGDGGGGAAGAAAV